MAYRRRNACNIPGYRACTPRAAPDGSATAGQIYYDATADQVYGYNGTAWIALSNQHLGFGGEMTTYAASGVTYVVHTFLSSGTFISRGAIDVDYLVVAGGGGAGRGGYRTAGGGGAGGLRSTVDNTGGGGSVEAAYTTSGQAYSITVGGGGVGAVASELWNAKGSSW